MINQELRNEAALAIIEIKDILKNMSKRLPAIDTPGNTDQVERETPEGHTVILIYPDYMSSNYPEFYVGWTSAEDPIEAIQNIRSNAIVDNTCPEDGECPINCRDDLAVAGVQKGNNPFVSWRVE